MCPPLCNSYNNDLRIENRAWTPLASRNSGSCPVTITDAASGAEVVNSPPLLSALDFFDFMNGFARPLLKPFHHGLFLKSLVFARINDREKMVMYLRLDFTRIASRYQHIFILQNALPKPGPRAPAH